MTQHTHVMSPVTVVGAAWCRDTRAALATLESMGVPFDFIDVDEDTEAADWVRRHNRGEMKLPTVKVANQILSVPQPFQLQAAVQKAMP